MKLLGRRTKSPLLLTLLSASVGLALVPSESHGITILLDYTYDTGNFFGSGTQERARLEDAAGVFENLLVDDLDAITPPGNWTDFPPITEAWQVTFRDPSDPSDPAGTLTVDDLFVPADTIIVYVGATDLPGSALGEAGPGGYNLRSIGGSAFEQAVETRGESGVGTTDFAPWGGSLTIDDTFTWDTSLGGNGTDHHLYTTLLHEFGHIVGLGTSDAWNNYAGGGGFTGPNAVAEFGGNVPLNGGQDHWAAGTTSEEYPNGASQEALLDPDIAAGDTKELTDVDVAALQDIGWEIAQVPEPSSVAFLGLGLALLARRRR